MTIVFYIHASLAVMAMGWAMLTPHAVHALLSAVISLLSLAVAMYSISAEVAAALEIIIYTGAIMVLFVFTIMLLKPERLFGDTLRLSKRNHVAMLFVTAAFLLEILWILRNGFAKRPPQSQSISNIAATLFGTYGFYVEVISFVLLGGFVTTIFIAKNLRGNITQVKQIDEVKS